MGLRKGQGRGEGEGENRQRVVVSGRGATTGRAKEGASPPSGREDRPLELEGEPDEASNFLNDTTTTFPFPFRHVCPCYLWNQLWILVRVHLHHRK